MECKYCELTILDYGRKLNSLGSLVKFLQEHGVFLKEVNCPNCEDAPSCTLLLLDDLEFVCPSNPICDYRVPITKGTIFENVPYNITKMCDLIGLWLLHFDQTAVTNDLDIDWQLVKPFVSELSYVRLVALYNDSILIGGENETVLLTCYEKPREMYLVIGQQKPLRNDIETIFTECYAYEKSSLLYNILLQILVSRIKPGTTIQCSEVIARMFNLIFKGHPALEIKMRVKFNTNEGSPSMKPTFSRDMFNIKYESKQRLHYFFKALAKKFPPTV